MQTDTPKYKLTLSTTSHSQARVIIFAAAWGWAAAEITDREVVAWLMLFKALYLTMQHMQTWSARNFNAPVRYIFCSFYAGPACRALLTSVHAILMHPYDTFFVLSMRGLRAVHF